MNFQYIFKTIILCLAYEFFGIFNKTSESKRKKMKNILQNPEKS